MFNGVRVRAAPELRRAIGGFAEKCVCRPDATPRALQCKPGYECGMKVAGKHTRSIWVETDGATVGVIDQTLLPHRFATIRLETLSDAARAIVTMQVRGAPLIGATAAYGICLALRADASDESLERAYAALLATRPTAINLKWALDEMMAAVRNRPREERLAAAYRRAARDCGEEVRMQHAACRPQPRPVGKDAV